MLLPLTPKLLALIRLFPRHDTTDTTGGAENDGHENAGHVSGVWIGLHGIDFDLAVLPSNRLLLRFQVATAYRETFDINIFNLRFNPTTLNTVECTVLFQRHLIFLDIHILDIFADTWYSCVLVLEYAFQLFYNYRRSTQTYLAAVTCILPLFWKELHTAL